jgi:glutaconate CoA-transferase subunit B
METAQRGFVEYGFLGGAQIDMHGNINSTVIGDQKKPKVRLPGSGGANDVGSQCWRTIILMPQDTRKFVSKVDFVTTPGYLTGPGAREKAGLPKNTGPYRVVTNLATLDFEPTSKRMRLIGLNPGTTKEDVIKNTGFELLIADNLVNNEPPTEKELNTLRNEVDKDKLYI